MICNIIYIDIDIIYSDNSGHYMIWDMDMIYMYCISTVDMYVYTP